MTALFMVIALTLTGCGQRGEKNAGATGSGDGNGSSVSEPAVIGPEVNGETTESTDEVDNRHPEMKDGYYVYEVDGVELLCKTNIWEYIDGDVWYRTKMFEDLGYERDDSIQIASRSPGFFRYVGDMRLEAYVGAPMDQNSDDFLDIRYLNTLTVAGRDGEAFEIIIRCRQTDFATDKSESSRTPIDIIICTAYFLEEFQDDMNNSYLYDTFSNADSYTLRIYQ